MCGLSLVFIKCSGSFKCRADDRSRKDPEVPLAVGVQNKFGFFEVPQSTYNFFSMLLGLSLFYLRFLQYCVKVFVENVHEITL